MATIQELQPLLAEPREDLDIEYKDWLDLNENDHRATLAKAAIALVNHGGGFLILGMREAGCSFESVARPDAIEQITQDGVNAAIQRFAEPEFHCQVYNVPHPDTGVMHPIIAVPGNLTVPVMCKRDCAGIIARNRCYIRKPGPRSEDPQTGEEWRALFDRCLRAGRADMLEAIRAVVAGRVEAPQPNVGAQEALEAFGNGARARWARLCADLPPESPARFPLGHYELGFGLVGAEPAPTLNALRAKLANARRVKLTGWTPFLEMMTPGWEPYAHEEFIEAWIGRPVGNNPELREPSHCDFWRAAPDGKLFTMRGYAEDSFQDRAPGEFFDVTLPVWRVGEGLLFANRLAQEFEGVEQIAVRCRFNGLRGRRLTSIDNRRLLFDDRISATDESVVTAQVQTEQVDDNLTEIVHGLLAPLYERFGFFDLPAALVDEELARLKDRRF